MALELCDFGLSGKVVNMIPSVMEGTNRNDSHGWDICEYADYNCFAAQFANIFFNTCSADYDSCETKCLRDYGGSR